jgi:hypothetical protein
VKGAALKPEEKHLKLPPIHSNGAVQNNDNKDNKKVCMMV